MSEPNLVPNVPASHQEIDDLARALAARALSGEIPETKVRWALAALIYKSRIPENVVYRAASGHGVSQRVRDDAVDHVRRVLTDMIAVGPNMKLDLQRLVNGASLCGWADRVVSGPMVYPKTNFDSRARRSREVIPGAYSISNLVAMRSLIDQDARPLYDEVEERRHSLIDNYEALAKGLRENELVLLNAEHICAVSNVPAPRRAVHVKNRTSLLTRLDESPDMVRRDLRQALTDGNAPATSLASLFSNLHVDDRDAVVALNPLASQMLARSALTPVPPPRLAVVKSLRDTLSKPAGGPRFSAALCRAYVEVVTEVQGSEFAPNSKQPRIKRVAERRDDQVRWENVTTRLIDRGRTAMGGTPDEVFKTIQNETRRIALERVGRENQSLSA